VQEIAPGIVHWRAYHEGIRSLVSSYMAAEGGVVLDPMPPREGFGALAEQYGEPQIVILTNRHHFRHAAELQERFAVPVFCHELGMHNFRGSQGVQPFAFGDRLPGGAVAYEVGALTPEETAIWFPAERALAFADSVVRMPPDVSLGFVPDELMGNDPERVKDGLREAFGRLVELDPAHLLLAHGLPVVDRGRDALAVVAAS
jgi:hypothetical protein